MGNRVKRNTARFGSSPKRVLSGSVKRLSEIQHLDPKSELHQIHALWSFLQKQSPVTLLPSDQFPTLGAQFPSIGEGIMYDLSGRELQSTQFSDLLRDECEDRSFYVRITNKGNGRYGPKIEPVANPLWKETITLSGRDNERLRALDNGGRPVKAFVRRLAKKLAKLYAKFEGMEVIAMVVHADSGCLHIHILFSHVSRNRKLLYKNPHQGNNRQRRAGLGLIGTKRMCDMEYWPAEDASKADYLLADREKDLGRLPTDYLLSRYIDRECDAFVQGLVKSNEKAKPSPETTKLRAIIAATDRKYGVAALARRERRILADKLFDDHDDLENINEAVADLTIAFAEFEESKGFLDRRSREKKIDDLWTGLRQIHWTLDSWRKKSKKRKPIEPSPKYHDALESQKWVLHLQRTLDKEPDEDALERERKRRSSDSPPSDPQRSGAKDDY